MSTNSAEQQSERRESEREQRKSDNRKKNPFCHNVVGHRTEEGHLIVVVRKDGVPHHDGCRFCAVYCSREVFWDLNHSALPCPCVRVICSTEAFCKEEFRCSLSALIVGSFCLAKAEHLD
jgi:hypothetical protein